eukprot:scaffold890_cov269-Pinguiococcus_pyrenoidosus.AAC.15
MPSTLYWRKACYSFPTRPWSRGKAYLAVADEVKVVRIAKVALEEQARPFDVVALPLAAPEVVEGHLKLVHWNESQLLRHRVAGPHQLHGKFVIQTRSRALNSGDAAGIQERAAQRASHTEILAHRGITD